MRLLAIDPGPVNSALLEYDVDAQSPTWWRRGPCSDMAAYLDYSPADTLAIEMVASYGMPVGREVFETCVWIGRFIECWYRAQPSVYDAWRMRTKADRVRRIYRRDVKLHLCGDSRAKDTNVRAALVDRYGGKDMAIGRKTSPGPLYGVAGDVWAALGVAVTAAETEAPGERHPLPGTSNGSCAGAP